MEVWHLIMLKLYVRFEGSKGISAQFRSVASHVHLFATPWTTARQASLSLPTPGAY